MSKSVNKAILVGNLGKAPEVKYTTSGKAVANFSLAIDERYKDKSGEWQDRTEWVNVVLWERLAEIAKEYLSKGSKCYIEGRLATRNYEKDGHKVYVTEVIGSELVLLGSKQQSSEPAAQPDSEDAPF